MNCCNCNCDISQEKRKQSVSAKLPKTRVLTLKVLERILKQEHPHAVICPSKGKGDERKLCARCTHYLIAANSAEEKLQNAKEQFFQRTTDDSYVAIIRNVALEPVTPEIKVSAHDTTNNKRKSEALSLQSTPLAKKMKIQPKQSHVLGQKNANGLKRLLERMYRRKNQRKVLTNFIRKTVQMETKAMLETKKHLGLLTLESLMKFSLESSVIKGIENYCPILLEALLGCSNKSTRGVIPSIRLGTALCVLLFDRNRKLRILQAVMSVLLWSGNTNEEFITLLNHLGLALSPTATRNLISNIRGKPDEQRQELETQPAMSSNRSDQSTSIEQQSTENPYVCRVLDADSMNALDTIKFEVELALESNVTELDSVDDNEIRKTAEVNVPDVKDIFALKRCLFQHILSNAEII